MTMQGDIALKFNFEELTFDFEVVKDDLALDEGLRTACILSLYCDRRVEPDEVPFGETSKRGWWGDLFADTEGDLTGSRLWLLAREKQTNDNLALAEDYAEEALQWLIDDGVVDTMEVTASYNSNNGLILDINLTKPTGNPISFRFEKNWQAERE